MRKKQQQITAQKQNTGKPIASLPWKHPIKLHAARKVSQSQQIPANIEGRSRRNITSVF
jgi:hypothetical protein